jgi:hypothetical protein
MAHALAAAVERLRARVATADEHTESERPSYILALRPQRAAAPADQPTAGSAAPSSEPFTAPGDPAPDLPAPAPAAPAPAPEVSTVFVVPRLFAPTGSRAGRLRPAVRRLAARLAEWADRSH